MIYFRILINGLILPYLISSGVKDLMQFTQEGVIERFKKSITRKVQKNIQVLNNSRMPLENFLG